MENKILDILTYNIPVVVIGLISFYYIKLLLKNLRNEQNLQLLKDKKRETLPIKLQAYERMMLFCSRIEPIKLITRIQPVGDEANKYSHLIVQHIEQEYSHNLVQQLYVSESCWNAITVAKLSVINSLKTLAENSDSVDNFKENLLKKYQFETSQTLVAIKIIKAEVQKII